MLRITSTIDPQGEESLRLEGRIAGPWVALLADSAASALLRSPRLALDLAAVTFADAEGTRVLRELVRGGARVTAASRFVRELLEGGP